MPNTKICFVICPIGQPGSEIRKRSDQVLNHIITPVVQECGYEQIIRADQIPKPGIITNQVIQLLIQADLVIADLKGHNPNVYYELAVRHMVGKPIIQIHGEDERLPFDVAQVRSIAINHQDLDSANNGKGQLKRQIISIENDPNHSDNPISAALGVLDLKSSTDPEKQILVQINNMFLEILERLRKLSIQSRIEDQQQVTHKEETMPPSIYGYDPDSPYTWIDSIMDTKGPG
jgi:hypothetical protein